MMNELKKFRRVIIILVAFIIISHLILTSINKKDIKGHQEFFNKLSYKAENFKELKYLQESRFLDTKCYHPKIDKYTAELDGEIYPKSRIIFYDKNINYSCLANSNDKKTILAWNGFFDIKFNKRTCPVQNCEFTRDRKLLNEADLVLVHALDDTKDLPSVSAFKRPAYQRWVFSLYESPIHSKDFSHLNGYFNLTSTYLANSDFPGLYEINSGIKWEMNSEYNTNFYDKKKKLAAAVISNCGAPSARMDYIRALQKYATIDVFGNCGKKCPENFVNGTRGNCKQIISEEYKFILVFENSFCKEYITEKLFDILRYNIIPVVYGGGDYKRYIPKSGFINAIDFQIPKQLADYLKYLDSNKTAYENYFNWKKHVTFAETIPDFICSVCIRLNMETHFGIRKGIVNNLGSYWTKGDCKYPILETLLSVRFINNLKLDDSYLKVIYSITDKSFTVSQLVFFLFILVAFYIIFSYRYFIFYIFLKFFK